MIKVHLILGFLGAGKTTFIKSYLNTLSDLGGLQLIVNDFGQEGFDAKILEAEGAEAVELSQGCLCCGLAESFYQVLQQSAKRRDIKRIIIEPSGVFIPGVVKRLFKDQIIAQEMELQPVVGVINSVLFTQRDFTKMPFIQKQIQNSDRIVLNRTCDISPDKIDGLKQRLAELSPAAKIYIDPTEYDIRSILDSNDPPAPIQRIEDDASVLSHPFHTVHVKDDIEFSDRKALQEWLTDKGDLLVRAKGVVQIQGQEMLISYTPNELNLSGRPETIEYGITLIFEHPKVKTY